MRKLTVLFLVGLICPALTAAGINQGKVLFETAGGYGCVVCHGPVAEGAGQAGGFIRGASLDLLNTSLEISDPMKPLATVLSDNDRANIATYLVSLQGKPLLTLTYSESGWRGQYRAWQTNVPADVVIYNETFDVITVELEELELAPITLNPLERKALEGSLINEPSKILPNLELTLEPL
jgi:cytochrome c553